MVQSTSRRQQEIAAEKEGPFAVDKDEEEEDELGLDFIAQV